MRYSLASHLNCYYRLSWLSTYRKSGLLQNCCWKGSSLTKYFQITADILLLYQNLTSGSFKKISSLCHRKPTNELFILCYTEVHWLSLDLEWILSPTTVLYHQAPVTGTWQVTK